MTDWPQKGIEQRVQDTVQNPIQDPIQNPIQNLRRTLEGLVDKLAENRPPQPQVRSRDASVVITDIHMPFHSMVVFMVKWAIAAIPALLILVVLTLFFWAVGLGFIRGLLGVTH